MFDHSFFSSKLGHAALVSIAAMITFAVFTQMQQDLATSDMLIASTPAVELA
ncbi:hypothetical protein [Aurantiacibacter sp. MUD61]|uniref:hypothetical protein n=1 Tax=Aurantiacibacter sp. MUD61 TaxID=3009083 RepID=UPI0022F0F54A|nr:hypothetical protein [Aurantiacibacter sp. MUD61]